MSDLHLTSDSIDPAQAAFQARHTDLLGGGVNSASLPTLPKGALSTLELQLRTRLIELADSHDIGPSASKLSKLSSNELLSILRYLPCPSRMSFAREIIFSSLGVKNSHGFIESKLPKIMHFMSCEERADLLSNLVDLPKTKISSIIAHEILWVSKDLKDLTKVVKAVGRDELLVFRNSDIRELIAHTDLGPRLRHFRMPAKLTPNSNRIIVNRKIAEIKEALADALELIKPYKDISRTEVAKGYIKSIRADLRFLDEMKKQTRNVTELRAVANLVIEKTKIQFKYGLSFTNGRDKNGGINRKWSEEELKDIKYVLNRIPEGKILWTAKLFEIRRVETLKDAMAHRHVKTSREKGRSAYGIIEVSDDAIGDKDLAANYQGLSSLKTTICHELCHGITDDGIDHKRTSTFFRYDFEEYIKISGWSVQRSGFKIHDGGLTMTLEGHNDIIHLDSPVIIDGKTFIFTHEADSNTLYRRDAFAEFSPGEYSKINPREDRCEAFTYYILLPKRLITFAPKKFMHLEEQFRVHERNEQLKQLVYARKISPASAIKPRDPSLPRDANRLSMSANHHQFLQKRFARLNPVEQSLVIAELIQSDLPKDKGSLIFDALSIYQKMAPQQRRLKFNEFLNAGPEDYEEASGVLLTAHKNYLSGLLAAITVFEKGESIGLLSARGNRSGSSAIINSIQNFTGFELERHNLYFVADEQRSERLSNVPFTQRKYQILKDFACGFYLDINGEQRQLSQKFERVIYYDHDLTTLQTLTEMVDKDGLTDKIINRDVNALSMSEIWEELKFVLQNKEKQVAEPARYMHFFNIDGTLINLNPRIYVVDKNSGKRLMELKPDELSSRASRDLWLERAQELHSDIRRDDLGFDFSDYNNEININLMVAEGADGNRMFKK